MKVVILAGGMGTRLAEHTDAIPKPMVEIGGRPILWHILKHYSHYGFNDFYVALGYKGHAIKRYLLDYRTMQGDLAVCFRTGHVDVTPSRDRSSEDWKVHLIDTGLDTYTGGRVKRLQRFLDGHTFMVTYGDGVTSLDLSALLRFHRSHGRLATLTAVRPPARFGGIRFDGDMVAEFTEKPQIGEGWINGGYLVLEPGVFDYLAGDHTGLEADAMERLARDGELAAYRHEGFWQCMDTVRDLRLLRALWDEGSPPWKVWE
jgi:glucose-1-phosphate cytidylyltransferase